MPIRSSNDPGEVLGILQGLPAHYPNRVNPMLARKSQAKHYRREPEPTLVVLGIVDLFICANIEPADVGVDARLTKN